VGKYVHHNRETEQIGFCTPLKSEIYFRFVSETTGIYPYLADLISEPYAKLYRKW